MYDCLIVGGGVIGLSIAYELSGHGLNVRVIDQGQPGKEASWAGAGILPPCNAATAVHPLEKLRALSHELHPQWSARLKNECGIDNGYRRCGGLYIARSAGEAASLHGLKSALDEERIDVQHLLSDAVADVEPALKPLAESGRLKAAYYLPDEAQLRNPDHLKALHACCIKRGVEITGGFQLREFKMSETHVTKAITNDGPIAANRFCICSGAWTHLLLKQLGISTGIMPVRGQMVMFKCDRKPFRMILNEGPRYFVPRDDGRVLVGSTEEEVGFDKNTMDVALDELMTLAQEVVPELTRERVERTWAGLRPGSYDGFPYLGPLPGKKNLFVAAGHFRSGLQLSTGTAVLMSQLLRGEETTIDMSPFRVGRG